MTRLAGILIIVFLSHSFLNAQEQAVVPEHVQDSLLMVADSLFATPPIIETAPVSENQPDIIRLRVDSIITATSSDAFFAPSFMFRPSPRKAVLYSAIFPGLGQAYNRKYWKIPIVYGGFAGFTYAISWNNGYYRDYQAAYADIRSDNPDADRWKNFLPYGMTLEDIGEERFTRILEQRRDFYRHYRDMSIILAFGLYFLAMIDAYVDAQLFDFDMSPDLSMRFAPAIINRDINSNINIRNAAYGFQWSLTF
ncbi:MAG: DUF5683 domain-containing protein [Dysgonamonadaceae bacterium]|jgi:hypothetical protein|nr:DUF5683 domain-containing protein [Dysgonamonadaceae bacterium]